VIVETCSTCIYHSGPPGVSSGRRECRANPPSMGVEVQYPGRPHPVVLGTWPLTLATDCCGGHKLDPAVYEVRSKAALKARLEADEKKRKKAEAEELKKKAEADQSPPP
jgi:hypothetical protein